LSEEARHCRVRQGKTKISEKGKFAWALGASLKRKAFQREGSKGVTLVIPQKLRARKTLGIQIDDKK